MNILMFTKKINPRHLPVLIYMVLGFTLLFFIILIFNTYVLHLKIETAVVSVPIEPISAPMSGFVEEIYVTPGSKVTRGTPLVKLENLELEKELQIARLELEESRLNIDYYQTLLNNEHQKLNIYKTIGSNRVTSAKALVDSAQQELIASENNLERMKKLHKKHFVSDSTWDTALQNFINAKEKLKSALAQMNLENKSLNSVDEGMYFTGNKLEGQSNNLRAELNAAYKKLTINQDKVKFFENLLKKLVLMAPFNGRITQVLKSPGNTADNTKAILLLEKTDDKKSVIAYLTQDEILHLKMNKTVKIYVPSIGKTYYGKVMSIDRTDGFIDEVKAQYQWRNLYVDRSATVIIDLDKRSEAQFNQDVAAGMPAIVYFSRKFTIL